MYFRVISPAKGSLPYIDRPLHLYWKTISLLIRCSIYSRDRNRNQELHNRYRRLSLTMVCSRFLLPVENILKNSKKNKIKKKKKEIRRKDNFFFVFFSFLFFFCIKDTDKIAIDLFQKCDRNIFTQLITGIWYCAIYIWTLLWFWIKIFKD